MRDSVDVPERRALLPWAPDRHAVARLSAAVLVVVLVDLWLGGPLAAVDARLMDHAIARHSPWRPLLHIPDGIGLRAVTAPILLLVSAGLAIWARTWRPLVLSILAVATLNVVVGAMKLLVNRGMPAADQPELFAGGVAWPSGHASNIALTMSLLVHLVGRYGGIRLDPRQRLLVLALPTGIMCSASVILGYHWLSDLIAGVAVGILVALGIRALDPDHPVPGDRGPSDDSGRPLEDSLSGGW